MIFCWDCFGLDYCILIYDDFICLVFDVIGFCVFNYCFNVFYFEELILFVKQLGDVFIEIGKWISCFEIQNILVFFSKRQMMENIYFMWKVCDDIVVECKVNFCFDIDDIFNVMFNVKDFVIGKGFIDENI